MLLLVLLMLFPWELATFSNKHTCSFPRVNILRHASKGDSKTSFLNQILYHANPHDKLSTIIGDVSKSWVPKYLPTNPLGSKTQSFLSFHIYDRGFGMENMSFDDLGLLLRVIEIRMVLNVLVHAFKSSCCNVTSSHTLWVFSYTLFYAYLQCGIYSCAHLIIVAWIIIVLSGILLLLWVKFAKISFHDEFIDYSPYFLLPCSYGLGHCSYGLCPKERKMFYVTMLWL
jgi:hypothetical protein